MAVQTFKNAPNLTTPEVAWSTLSGAINAAVTSLTVASAAAFPASAQFTIAIENELLLVTGVAGAVFTVTRGVESTTAATHASGTSVFHILTAASLLRCPRSMTTTGDLEYLDSSGAPTRWAAAADGSSLTYGGDTTLGRGDGAGQMTLSAGSSVANLRLKNGSNAELGSMRWSSDTFIMGTQGGVGAGVARVTILGSADDLYLATANVTRWTVDDLLGHFRPFADATYDLGGSTRTIRAAYLNQVQLPTTGTLVFSDLTLGRAGAATLQLGADVNGAAVSQLVQAANGITGTDKTGGDFTLASGKGTGAGAVSSLIFQTPAVLGSGTTAQSLVTRLTLTEALATFSGPVTITGATILSSTLAANGTITMGSGIGIATNTGTGTIIATAASQKLGIWGAAAIVQPTTGVAAATFAANTSLIANDTATFDGYSIGQAIRALRNIGLLA